MKKTYAMIFLVVILFSFLNCSGGGVESELKKIIGESEGWSVDVFNNIKLNMSYDDVKAIYPQLEDDQDYPYAYLEDHPVVDYYAFYFDEGKLINVEVDLRDDLDVDEAEAACLSLLKAKWGEPNEDEDRTYVWYDDDYNMKSLYLYGDEDAGAWVIDIDLK